MPSQPHLPRMPRVYLIRHGETEWALNGRHTGRTDIPLTQHGVDVMAELGSKIVGDDRFLNPQTLSLILKSPRQRTQKTFALLTQTYKGKRDLAIIPSETTEDVREWDYGDYEGITSHDIHLERPGWDIFDDGCPNGESVQEMTDRVDAVIKRVQEVHREYWHRVKSGDCKAGTEGGDVLLVTHGHFSKSFLARWCGLPISTGRTFIVDAGGISVASYDHRDLKEPALQALNLYAL